MNRRRAFAFLLAAPAAALAAPKAAPPLEGKVTRVADAATLVVQPAAGEAVSVRLEGVEPLEPCQAGAAEARQALAEWAQGRVVSVKAAGSGRNGALVGRVFVEGEDLSRRLVAEGHAFSTRTKWDRGPYVREERVAASLRRGMYGGGAPERPADFRRSHGPCAAGAQ